jgi:diadenylate cyclase
MTELLQRITDAFRGVSGRITWVEALDILVLAILIYQFLLILRGRRASQILTGIGVLLAIYFVASWLGLLMLRNVLQTAAGYAPLAIVVMFQSEIRRLLARIGRRWSIGFTGRLQGRESVEEIIMAVQHFQQTRTGALIVIERDIGLRTFVETGVAMDAQLTRDLLLAIFYPGNALHDGAAIIQGERILAAACFLPLATTTGKLGNLGTRHRAAIGVTEEADCLAIVVSEETGRVSWAEAGKLEYDVEREALEEKLLQSLLQRRLGSALRPASVALEADSMAEEEEDEPGVRSGKG